MMVFIHEPDDFDELVEIIVDGDTYDVVYDDITDDWMIHSEDDPLVQGAWFRTKDGAMQYALDRAGVIEDATYERAPERC